MLEMRDRKYVLATEDGGIVAAYWDVEDAKIDAQDIWESEGKKLQILEMTHSIEIEDGIYMKVYKKYDWEPEEKKDEVKEETPGEEKQEDQGENKENQEGEVKEEEKQEETEEA